jgi:hypothetical protein
MHKDKRISLPDDFDVQGDPPDGHFWHDLPSE